MIFAWLLARPIVLVGIGAVALLGVRELQHFFEVRGLRKDISELNVALDKEKIATAEFRVALANVEANRDKLESTIREMNERLDAMNARARQIESAANLRVARAIRAGEEAAAGATGLH